MERSDCSGVLVGDAVTEVSPGDHLAVYAANDDGIVQRVMDRIKDKPKEDDRVTLSGTPD